MSDKYNDLTLEELQTTAGIYGITGDSKAELIKKLVESENKSVPTPENKPEIKSEPEFNLEYWKSLFFECENKFNKLEESYNFNNEQSEKEITEVKKKNDKLLQNNIKFSNDINKLEREKQTVHETNISLHGKVKDLQDKNDSLITEQTTTRMTIAEYEKRNTV